MAVVKIRAGHQDPVSLTPRPLHNMDVPILVLQLQGSEVVPDPYVLPQHRSKSSYVAQ